MWVSTNITFQVAKLVSDVEDVDQIREELEQEVRQNEAKETKRAVYSISAKTECRRQSAPPTGTASCSESSLRQCRQETMKAASAIHGGSSSSMEPATIGMVDTQEKRSGKKDLLMAIGKSGKMKKNILPQIYKEDLVKFESSNKNMIRSIAVYYNSGVMGKDKYRSVYRASSYKQVVKTKRAVCVKVANCPTPRLVPYHRLMSYIKSIDIGKLHNVRQRLCDGLEESEKVNGCYREIEELLLKLAEFYLNSDQYNVKF